MDAGFVRHARGFARHDVAECDPVVVSANLDGVGRARSTMRYGDFHAVRVVGRRRANSVRGVGLIHLVRIGLAQFHAFCEVHAIDRDSDLGSLYSGPPLEGD